MYTYEHNSDIDASSTRDAQLRASSQVAAIELLRWDVLDWLD
jgi:hypothetical protein